MTVEVYIDNEEKTIIVGKPSFEYEVVHTEYDPLADKKKIWVKKKWIFIKETSVAHQEQTLDFVIEAQVVNPMSIGHFQKNTVEEQQNVE